MFLMLHCYFVLFNKWAHLIFFHIRFNELSMWFLSFREKVPTPSPSKKTLTPNSSKVIEIIFLIIFALRLETQLSQGKNGKGYCTCKWQWQWAKNYHVIKAILGVRILVVTYSLKEQRVNDLKSSALGLKLFWDNQLYSSCPWLFPVGLDYLLAGCVCKFQLHQLAVSLEPKRIVLVVVFFLILILLFYWSWKSPHARNNCKFESEDIFLLSELDGCKVMHLFLLNWESCLWPGYLSKAGLVWQNDWWNTLWTGQCSLLFLINGTFS